MGWTMTLTNCYACSATATLKCQGCGVLGCVQHVQGTLVAPDGLTAIRLLCRSCCSSATKKRVVGYIVGGIALTLLLFGLIGAVITKYFIEP